MQMDSQQELAAGTRSKWPARSSSSRRPRLHRESTDTQVGQ